MRRAAELWAQARQRGQPTADDRTIDGDMILAGQGLTLGTPDVIIKTEEITVKGDRVSVKLKARPETLQVSEAHAHLFKQM